MRNEEFDYDLPRELIAQRPAGTRAGSRLLVLNRRAGITHHRFEEFPAFLVAGDTLVLNESRVIPVRFRLRKTAGAGKAGGAVDVLLIRALDSTDEWEAMLKPGSRIHAGTALVHPSDPDTELLRVMGRGAQGLWRVRASSGSMDQLLDGIGEAPLPPYIKRPAGSNDRTSDLERYQTVYARVPGSVAAPTAGLHFTPELLSELERRGVSILRLALHVGPGTFKPLRGTSLDEHSMDSERYEVSEETVKSLRTARMSGGRIIATGTTCARVLESLAPDLDGMEGKQSGETSLFITPGHRFSLVRALLTNFHAPRSSPYVLVCAFAGMDWIRASYKEAMQREYRFLSYGDAMLIL